MATLSPRRATPRFAGLLALVCLACLMAPARVAADDVAVTGQSEFETAVESALESSGSTSIIASGDSAFVAGSDWVLPGDAASLAITFNTSPFQIGNADGDASLTLQSGSSITLNTTSGSSLGRIEIGNGGTGALTLDGGTIRVNLADTSTTPGTSIGRIWVGGGSTNTTGGTGTLTIISGELLYSANAGSLNYGGLAVGRGGGVTGTVNQSGGTARFDSAGALDLGTQGGTGSYTLSGDAVFDAGSGGLTAYIGSRTAGAGGTGTAATGTLTISDTASFTMTTGDFVGGQLYVGDSKGTGTITQDGAGSSVTLTLANPIRFGSDVSNVGTGGTGTYNLSAGTLTIGSGGGSSQVIFGAASGGTGTFNISGGSADIAAPLVLASVEGASGTVNMTGGALTLSGSSYLSFGSGTGTFNLDGGTFTVGGSNGIRGTGTFSFGGGTLKVGSDLTTSNAMTLASGETATIDTNGNSATLSGVLSGSGALTKAGGGTLTLSGVNTYTGTTTISGGTVQIAANSGLGATSGSVTFSGGTLATTGTVNVSRVTTLSESGGTIAPASNTTLTWNGKISGSGALTVSGAGTLVLGGLNDYTGGTTINSGTVSINAETRLGNTSGALTMAGGTLAINASITITRAISLTGAATISTSATPTISSGMTGSGGLTKSGTGTLILRGANTYSGGTTISSGTLQIGNAGTSGSITGNVTNNATLSFSRSDALTFGGNISGTGAVSMAGGGTLTLSGSNTYSGGTTVSAGTLQVSADANLGDSSGSLTISGSSSNFVTTASFTSGRAVILGNGYIKPDTGTTLTLSGVLSGTLLRMGGAGTLVLSGTNTYTLSTSISGGGTLQVSADANLGAGTQISFTNGTLATTETFSSARTVSLNGPGTFTPSIGTSLTLTGVISGSGSLTKAGTGTLVLAGTNTYTGDTTVSAGTLQVTGSVVGDAQIADGATIGGSGSVAGLVTIADGGTLAGTQGAGLTMGGLVLASGSNLDVTLGAGSGGGVFTVNGDVTLAGTLNVTKATDFGAGLYGLISYTGTLTDNGLELASLGSGYTGVVQTAQAGAVNLVVDESDSALQFWNGSTTTATGSVEGGDGTWTANPGSTNWTTVSGTIPRSSNGGFAIFQGSAGTVTIDTGDGDVTASGLQFVTSGYVLTGGTLTLTGDEPATIRVGDGTEDGAATIATIESVIAGTSGLNKTDLGTLILSGENTYSGGTILSAGTVQITADSALGDATGGLTFNGGTLAVGDNSNDSSWITSARDIALTGTGTFAPNGASTLTLSGVISGTGSLVMSGDGFLILTGTNTYSGGTTVSAGILQVGADAALGDASGGVTLSGGALMGIDTFTSARAITLVSAGTIAPDSGTTLTLTGDITGAALIHAGAGTLILSGAKTYAGGTTVSGGTLQIAADESLGDVSKQLSLSGTLKTTATFSSARAINLGTAGGTFSTDSDTTLTLSGVLSGNSGKVTKTGDGTLVLTGTNTYRNGTTISAGTLQIGADSALGNASGSLKLSGGTLATTATFSSARTVSLTSAGTISTATGTTFTLTGVISGAKALTKSGSGTLLLSGANTYTGGTTVSAGTLNVTGSLSRGATVADGGTLKGTGSVANTVTVADGGTLAGGQGAGLTVGGLVLASGSSLDVTLGATTAGGVFTVNGDLTLDGTLNVTKATDFGAGVYGIISYTGTLTDNGLTVASLGSGFGGMVQTSQEGEVNLVVEGADATIQFWNGSTTMATGSVAGGDGTWTAGEATNWTSAGGVIPQASNGGFAVFQGTAGTVTIDDTDGSVSATGMQFVTSGYTLTGDALTLIGTGSAAIRVGDGTDAGATTIATINSVLSGTAGLDKTDLGTLVLSAINTYSGGTTISAGTLRIGADSALGDSSGTLTIATGTLATTATFTSARAVSLTGDATIDTADATSLTLSGAISGAGSLTKSGTGTLIISGDAGLVGTITIEAGTLQIGDGGTTGTISGDIVNNGTLVFNRSDAYTVAGTITGSGTLTLSGGGTASFTSALLADMTLEDATAVLAEDSVTTAAFTVGEGGVLGGTASIGGLIVNAGGTVAPGYSPGILTVTGPVTFNAGSVYAVDVTPDGSHDQIIASGDVTLSTDAHVEVLASGGVYDRESELTILSTSGTLTGEFGGVTSNFAFLLPTLRYDAQNVYLDLVYTGADIDGFARTSNQVSVAHAIQALGDGNDLFDAITLLAEDAVAPALDQLSGEIYPSINTVISQQGGYLRDAVGARLRQSGAGALGAAARSAGPVTATLDRDPSSVFWMQGLGAWDKTLGNGNAASITSSVGGLYIGADAAPTDTLRAGFVAGYSGSRLSVDDRASSGNMESAALGAYVGAQFGALGLQGGIAYGWHGIDVTRSIVFPGFADQQSATYGVGALQLFGEASYRLAVAGFEVEPFANLAYVNLSGGSARETGLGAAGLTIDVAGQQTLYTTLGTRLATTIELEGATITPSLSLGWQHAFGDTATSATMQSGSTPFSVEGVPIATDSLMLGAGVAYDLSDALSLELNYAGKFAAGANQNAVTARLSGRF